MGYNEVMELEQGTAEFLYQRKEAVLERMGRSTGRREPVEE